MFKELKTLTPMARDELRSHLKEMGLNVPEMTLSSSGEIKTFVLESQTGESVKIGAEYSRPAFYLPEVEEVEEDEGVEQ